MSTKLLNKVYICTKNIHYWLLPGTCVLCKSLTGGFSDLCDGCACRLPVPYFPCINCGLPLPSAGVDPQRCGACINSPPPFHYCLTALRYAPPVDTLISGFKYHGRLAMGKILAERMVPVIKDFYVRDPMPQLLIPIPLHPSRLRRRGYNQALELCRHLSRHLGIPADTGCCKRTGKTPPQSGLPAGERRKNLKNAFTISHPDALRNIARVALVDDVVTTMSTARELTGLLKARGIAEVHVWAAARTCR